MLTLSIKSTSKAAQARLKAYGKQVPYAQAKALNFVAEKAKLAVYDEMKRVFRGGPTRWTLNSLYIKYAKKSDVSATIKVKDVGTGGTPAVKYLYPEVDGGPRHIKRFELALRAIGALPKGMTTAVSKYTKTDAFGNVPPAVLREALRQLRAGTTKQYRTNKKGEQVRKGGAKLKGYFSIPYPWGNQTAGLYYRDGSGIHLVLVYIDDPRYKKRLDFQRVVNRMMKLWYRVTFYKELAKAIATAK